MPRDPSIQPDLTELENVETVAPPSPASIIYPDAPTPFLRSPLPQTQWLQPDNLRQYYRLGHPQDRIAPLPTTALPSINANAGSVTKASIPAIVSAVSKSVSGAGLTSVGLSMPPQYLVGNSPLTSNGTIGVTWGPAPYGDYLGVTPVANLPYPDGNNTQSLSGVSSMTTTYTTPNANDLTFYCVCNTALATTNFSGPTGGGWTQDDGTVIGSVGMFHQYFTTANTSLSQATSYTAGGTTTSPGLSQLFCSFKASATPVVTVLSGRRTGALSQNEQYNGGSVTIPSSVALISIASGDWGNAPQIPVSLIYDNQGNQWFPISVTSQKGGATNSSTYVSMWFCPNPKAGSTIISILLSAGFSGNANNWTILTVTNLASSSNTPQWLPLLANELQGVVQLGNGGTGTSLAATGGTNQVVFQNSAGAALSVGTFDYNQLLGTSAATTYLSQSLTAPGLPYIVADVSVTGQTAAHSGTNLPLSGLGSNSGMTRFTWMAKVTTAATTSSTLGGTTGFQIGYQDSQDSVSVTTPVWFGCDNNGAAPTAASLNTTQVQLSGVITINRKASSSLTYSFGYTSSGATAMAYYLHIKAEQLN